MIVETTLSDARVATLTIKRHEKRNAINREITEALECEAGRLHDNPDVRAVVLQSEGEKVFSAGADLNELASLNEETAREFIDGLRSAIDAVYRLPVPVICRIQGPCIGGAMELAAACDLRIASSNATFCMPEVRVGIPSVIQAAILPRLMGQGRADWLVLSGDVIDASRAYDWGFLEFVVPGDDLDAAVSDAVQSILSSAPDAVRTQKRLCRDWQRLSLDDAILASVDTFAAAYKTNEPQDYMAKITKKK